MQIVRDKITIDKLQEMANKRFGNLVKAVVDIKRGIMAVDAPLHADQEKALLEDGSSQFDLWGLNFYPEKKGEDFIEFDSMINIRPVQGNMSRGVDDEKIREKIIEIVKKLVIGSGL